MSWIASNAIRVNVRERTLIALSGIAPDLDGVGLLIDPVTKQLGHITNHWGLFLYDLKTMRVYLRHDRGTAE